MEVIHSKENGYFLNEAGMSFMLLVVHELNRALKKNGVKSRKKRKKVCQDFLFHSAYNQEAGWFIHDDKKLFPVICLAERAKPKAKKKLGRIATLHVPTQFNSWHECAFGVVDEYFDDNDESLSEIRTGSYGYEY